MKKPNPAAQAAIAEANARLAESKQKDLATIVAEADVAPRATDKQVRDAKKKAESAARVTEQTTALIDQAKPKRTGRRQSDPVVVVPEISVAAGTLAPGVVNAEPETDVALSPDGSTVDQPLVRPDKSAPYGGPMLALRARLKAGVYTKAENGNPSCGDEVAVALGKLVPAEVIRACLIAMALDVNPYLHLNIGQQSMNLRNKLRGKLKKNEFGMGVVREAVEEVMAERPAPTTPETKE